MRSQEFSIKTGETLLVREALASDAAPLLAYVNAVAGETDFLTFGSGEFQVSPTEEVHFIESCREIDNHLLLLAEIEEKLVGTLVFQGGERPRDRHVGEFGVTVARKWWGRGVGSCLLRGLIEWAEGSEGAVRKINLKVRADNTRAIRLYERFGFIHEGRLSREFLIDGVFHDALVMGRAVD